jgi:hypothetical protein
MASELGLAQSGEGPQCTQSHFLLCQIFARRTKLVPYTTMCKIRSCSWLPYVASAACPLTEGMWLKKNNKIALHNHWWSASQICKLASFYWLFNWLINWVPLLFCKRGMVSSPGTWNPPSNRSIFQPQHLYKFTSDNKFLANLLCCACWFTFEWQIAISHNALLTHDHPFRLWIRVYSSLLHVWNLVAMIRFKP